MNFFCQLLAILTYVTTHSPKSDNSGCTLTLAIITPTDAREFRVIIAHVGDSRAVLGDLQPNGRYHTRTLTHDYKPEEKEEKKRIENAGGFVSSTKRVDGHLNMSRALGDRHLKEPLSLPPEKRKVEQFLRTW